VVKSEGRVARTLSLPDVLKTLSVSAKREELARSKSSSGNKISRELCGIIGRSISLKKGSPEVRLIGPVKNKGGALLESWKKGSAFPPEGKMCIQRRRQSEARGGKGTGEKLKFRERPVTDSMGKRV